MTSAYIYLQDTGLHYDRYLREVIDFLEKDPHFREKLHNTDMEAIKVWEKHESGFQLGPSG